jgi:hypothetical protein
VTTRIASDVAEARLNHLIDRARRGALLPAEADQFTTGLRDLVRRLEDTEDDLRRVQQKACSAAEALRLNSRRLDAVLADRENERAARAAEEKLHKALKRAHVAAAEQGGKDQAAIERVRATCSQLRAAAVLADGEPHTDRERGITAAVTRVLDALDEQRPTTSCGHCDHPADWHDLHEGCVGPNGIGGLGSGDCTCTRSPDQMQQPTA